MTAWKRWQLWQSRRLFRLVWGDGFLIFGKLLASRCSFWYGSNVKLKEKNFQRNTLMALVVVSTTCVLSSVAYGALFVFIRKHSFRISKWESSDFSIPYLLSRSLRREVSLALQVFILLLAFFGILVYYSFQNYFSQTHNVIVSLVSTVTTKSAFQTGPIYYMRGIYPMANGFLSYINPFCILFLNKDLTKQVIRSVSCKKLKMVSYFPDERFKLILNLIFRVMLKYRELP